MNTRRIVMIVAGVVIAALIAAIAYVLLKDRDGEDEVNITSFEQCVAAGFEVSETEPPTCQTDNGETFTGASTEPPEDPTDEAISTEVASAKGIIVSVDSPLVGEVISSPLAITGSVPGSWSFEASFGIELLDGNGEQVAESYAVIDGEWMTEDMVVFEASIEFTAPSTATGTLVLHKANPSDDRSRDDRVEIPIRFTE